VAVRAELALLTGIDVLGTQPAFREEPRRVEVGALDA
jgi:hypothetical protein